MKSGEEYSKLEAQCRQLREELDLLRSSHASKTDSHSNLESSMQSLNIQLRAVETDRDRLKERLNKALQDFEAADKAKRAAQDMYQDEITKSRANNETIEQMRRNLDVATAENTQLKAELQQLRSENRQGADKQNELLRRMTADSESTKLALEKAITSSVRLCVVAPTVNVHIPTGKMNLKSRLGQFTFVSFLLH
jgi:chromosome segregation ATPase